MKMNSKCVLINSLKTAIFGMFFLICYLFPVYGQDSTITGVVVTPNEASITAGQTLQFNAVVFGTNNPDQSVRWSVANNTSNGTNISETGLLTVADDERADSLSVTAASVVDWNRRSIVMVAIPGIGGSYDVNSVASYNSAINAIRNGGNNKSHNIRITGNISVPPVPSGENLFGYATDITVNIEGNGVLTLAANGSMFNVGAGQTVIISNLTLRGRDNNDSSLVLISTGGTFRLEGNASITGNTKASNSENVSGGGVYIDGGIFIMQDRASVTGNTVNCTNNQGRETHAYGGGVYVASGTLIMQNNTSVTGNNVNSSNDNYYSNAYARGSGVFIHSGTMIMRDNSTISSNNVRASNNRSGDTYAHLQGGAVFINNLGIFLLEGGTISGHTASLGGGVYLNGGRFLMESGTIISNTATGQGGGVYIANGTLTMQGGSIRSNIARGNGGGGVWLNNGSFSMQSGTIQGNNTVGTGGGLHIAGGTFTKTFGIIYGNDAALNQGNVSSRQGHAIYMHHASNPRWRNATAGFDDATDGFGFWLNETD